MNADESEKDLYLGGCLEDRNQCPQMARKQCVIQGPILLLQTLQKRVLCDVSRPRLDLVPRASALFIER